MQKSGANYILLSSSHSMTSGITYHTFLIIRSLSDVSCVLPTLLKVILVRFVR